METWQEKKMQSEFGAHLDCTLDRLTDNIFIQQLQFFVF